LGGYSSHQNVVVDVVEELRQVEVHCDAKACLHVGLYLLERSMGATVGTEPEARCREPRIEDRAEDLRDGLLDQPIQHVGYSQRPLAPATFGDHDSPHRLRTIAAIE
jgi:hypothetical protein